MMSLHDIIPATAYNIIKCDKKKKKHNFNENFMWTTTTQKAMCMSKIDTKYTLIIVDSVLRVE